MKLYLDCVEHFHQEMRIAFAQDMDKIPLESLISSGQAVLQHSAYLEVHAADSDKRYLRAHLLLEEAAETVIAMGQGDEEKALDGLTDLLYVLLGTAVTFKWPLEEAFSEVHKSNMTKIPQEDDPSRARVRQKGNKYQPPNIKRCLDLAKSGRLVRKPSGLPNAWMRSQAEAVKDANPLNKLQPVARALVNTVLDALTASPESEQAMVMKLKEIVSDV